MTGPRRRAGLVPALVATALLAVGLAACTPATPEPSPRGTTPAVTPAPTTAPVATGSPEPGGTSAGSVTTWPVTATGRDWYVLVGRPRDTEAVAAALRATGAAVTSTNTAVGMVTVRTAAAGFGAVARAVPGVDGAATDRDPAWSPEPSPVESPSPSDLAPATGADLPPPPPAGGDPLDGWLWAHPALGVTAAHEVTLGRPTVRVGVIDTGVDASHPDLVGVVDTATSRSFVVDDPEIDGPCEHPGCVDPATEDGDTHGTHVAGIIAAAANGLGVSGIAPRVRLVSLRAGQDSGYFFTGPTVNAITASGDLRLDVVNLSFYVDPWLYVCAGGAPGDSPEQVEAQRVVSALVTRALAYAHGRGVTLVAAAGNERRDLARPGTDEVSPNYGASPQGRRLDPARCRELPAEDPSVLGVTAVDRRGGLAGYSNWTSDPGSDEVDLAAPGGDLDAPEGRQGRILSTAARSHLLARGWVDAAGRVTRLGAANGVVRDCPAGLGAGVPDPGRRCGLYLWLSGTSMAAPQVTGVVALAESAHGRMSPDAVAALLARTATDTPCPPPPTATDALEGPVRCTGTTARNGFFGEGVASAARAVR